MTPAVSSVLTRVTSRSSALTCAAMEADAGVGVGRDAAGADVAAVAFGAADAGVAVVSATATATAPPHRRRTADGLTGLHALDDGDGACCVRRQVTGAAEDRSGRLGA